MLSTELENLYSLKYNIALDNLIGQQLFYNSFNEIEVKYYLSKINKYGVPLDSRETYIKADWLIWVSLLTTNINKRKIFIKSILCFLNDTEDCVPLSDWYDTITAKCVINNGLLFRNRSVLGVLFIKKRLLVEFFFNRFLL